MEFNEEVLKNYQKNGLVEMNFNAGPTYNHFKSVLRDISNEKIKRDGWFLKSKYQGAKDFRPDVNSYDSVFIDILIENEIDKKINFLTQRDLCLAHIQIRNSDPGFSYMSWHRDSYNYAEASFGIHPPGTKLIYYLPEAQGDPAVKLQVIRGSQLCMMNDISKSQEIAPGLDVFDRDICLKNLHCHDFKNVDRKFVIFDTSCIHNVTPSTYSTRIIYSFCTEFQFYKKFHSKENKNRDNHYNTFKTFNKKRG